MGVLFQAFLITVHRLKLAEGRRADLVIAPDLGHTSGQLGFSDRARLSAAGERAAEGALEQVRALFEQARR